MTPASAVPLRGASGLYVAWLVALIATIGSLWFSEVHQFLPCTLCWYQRILMYPLAIVLGIGAWRGDVGVVRYALPFSLLGVLVAGYHVGVQKIPGFGFPAACRSGVPCNAAYIDWLGFITIPVLALTAFLLITAVLVAANRSR
ncbi:MAG: disulfide oxidoreductase [Trueperaceae bacterium]